MKYQLGDVVLILHSNEEGRIVDFVNEQMVMVEVKGVTFPVYMDQIDFPYFKRFSEKKKPVKKERLYVDDLRKEKAVTAEKKEDGVWLNFLPVIESDEFGDPVVTRLKLYLLNRTSTGYAFQYRLHYFGKEDFRLDNDIEEHKEFYLHDIAFSTMNDSPSFDFEFRLLRPDRQKAESFESSIRLKPKQLFARIQQLQEKNEASFSQRLFEHYPGKLVEEKLELDLLSKKGYRVYDAAKAREHLEPARSVVDLHIDKLTDTWNSLAPIEILEYQLNSFEKYYDLAVAHHQAKLTVIHGVGEGRLREEIHERLRLKNEVSSFVNQFHPQFGFGATEIFFKP